MGVFNDLLAGAEFSTNYFTTKKGSVRSLFSASPSHGQIKSLEIRRPFYPPYPLYLP